MSNHTQITLISSLQKSEFSHIVWEIVSEKDILKLWSFGLSTEYVELARENLHTKATDQKKSITLYVQIGNVKKISLFFPEKWHLMDDRSEFFRTLETNTTLMISEKVLEAYESLRLASYRYQEYLSKKKKYHFAFVAIEKDAAKIKEKDALYDAIIRARDIINMPPQDANPETLMKRVKNHPWKHFTVEVFDQEGLKKLGCNLLLAVGAGSKIPPYMVILRPKNPPKTEKYALIGKGVTFDAGGIQIKPDTAMLDMKCDMSGAAGMIGVAEYLDTRSTLPVDLTIAIGLTENMTGGAAYKPLDIYKAYNGTTVEIHHTDAEWRLVLADVMSYVEKNHHVDHIITMATLTGACVYALGHDIAGIMGDDEEVIRQLIDNSSPYEQVWRLPLNEKLKKSLKADIADLKNVARSEKAGSSIGWAFLSYFQWKAKLTHLDIAGPAYRETNFGYMPKGGTGWGVKLLSEFLLQIGKK